MERSYYNYEQEFNRLKNFHDEDEQSLLDQIDAMDSDGKKLLTVKQQLNLVRRLDKNDKLQVTVDNMEAALDKAHNAMSVASRAKCLERHTKYARQLRQLDCIASNPPKIPNPPPNFSTSEQPKFLCCGWFANNDEPIQPLPLSLCLAGCGALRHPQLRLLGKLPEDVAHWPGAGFMSLDERKKVMSWIQGRISARDRSRSVYPPDDAARFAYWLHMRVRKPGEKKMRTFRAHWSGLSSQDLIDRYEEENDEGGSATISRRVVHCILADVLTYTPYAFKWDKRELKLVEDGDGNQWPLLWSDLLSLPGPVPEFSADRDLCASHLQRCA